MLGAGFLPEAGGLIGIDAGATGFLHQQATNCQRHVPQGFAGKPDAGAPGEETIVRIAFPRSRGGRHTGLPIGRAEDETAAKGFHIPAVLHEIQRQPIQQFGM